jgi:integrase
MAWIVKRHTRTGPVYDVRYRVARRVITKTFDRKVDADQYQRRVAHQEITGELIDPRSSRITYADWWNLWWPTTVNLRPSTRARDESIYRTHLARFAGTRLGDITRRAVQQLVADLQAAGKAPTTVHKTVQVLSKSLRAAVDDGRLLRNPAERLDLPRIEPEERRYLAAAEVHRLADAIEPDYRALVLLGAYCGLRLGEMLALRRRHVDLLRLRVEVHSTIYELNGELVENAPKTRAGRRAVPLPKIVVDALDAHLHATPHDGADSYLFTAPHGGPVRTHAWRRRVWTPAVRAAGLEPLTPHGLRHTAVAFWIHAGASPNEVKARAGINSVVTVLDRYGHLFPDGSQRVTDALDDIARDADVG